MEHITGFVAEMRESTNYFCIISLKNNLVHAVLFFNKTVVAFQHTHEQEAISSQPRVTQQNFYAILRKIKLSYSIEIILISQKMIKINVLKFFWANFFSRCYRLLTTITTLKYLHVVKVGRAWAFSVRMQ